MFRLSYRILSIERPLQAFGQLKQTFNYIKGTFSCLESCFIVHDSWVRVIDIYILHAVPHVAFRAGRQSLAWLHSSHGLTWAQADSVYPDLTLYFSHFTASVHGAYSFIHDHRQHHQILTCSHRGVAHACLHQDSSRTLKGSHQNQIQYVKFSGVGDGGTLKSKA